MPKFLTPALEKIITTAQQVHLISGFLSGGGAHFDTILFTE
jgi:hypothetical protein